MGGWLPFYYTTIRLISHDKVSHRPPAGGRLFAQYTHSRLPAWARTLRAPRADIQQAHQQARNQFQPAPPTAGRLQAAQRDGGRPVGRANRDRTVERGQAVDVHILEPVVVHAAGLGIICEHEECLCDLAALKQCGVDAISSPAPDLLKPRPG